MKSVLLGIFVLGFAVLGGAQTPGVLQEIRYGSVKRVNDVYQMRGNVQIRIGTALITADEADLEGATRAWTLRGNVRMVIQQ